jgi:hypothetical protein
VNSGFREHGLAAVEADHAALRRERRGQATSAAGHVELDAVREPRQQRLESPSLASLARGREALRGVGGRAAGVAEDLADARAVLGAAQTSVISLVFFSSAPLTLPS